MQASPSPLSPAVSPQGASSVPKAALMALAVSLSLNTVLFLAGSAMGAFPPEALLPNNEPMTILPVLIATASGIVTAALAFAGMRRFLRTPVLAYRILAVLVLVLAAQPPRTIPNVSMAMMLVLNTMHLVVVSSTIWAFTLSKR